jgi:thiol peroxidase
MAEVRKGAVTMKGNPKDLVGPELHVGDKAPEFCCAADAATVHTLKDSAGKVRFFSVVPSLDTPVCSLQTKKFNDQFESLGEQAMAYTISLDLPFAMKRFCSAEGITRLTNLSDAHDHSFGTNYGVLIQGLAVPLLARAIFVVDGKDVIKYVEIVPEIGQEPNYAAAMAALESAVKG